jgi:hypothetical protein
VDLDGVNVAGTNKVDDFSPNRHISLIARIHLAATVNVA